jgi:hypothetical protein
MTELPAFSVPRAHVRVAPAGVQLPWPVVDERYVSPEGTVSLSPTSVALAGPWSVTVNA